MDESTLNDLLECSVCLDRLDTTSKVLPCQHTFCRKCLENIVSSHKALRCPECRILIDIKIDELPPNVLLMRILGGMKTATQPSVNNESTVTTTSTITAIEQPKSLIDLSLPSEGQLPPPHVQAHSSAVVLPAPQLLQPPMPTTALHHHQPHHPGAGWILQPNNAQMPAPSASVKPSSIAAVGTVPQARALFDYVSKDQGDISFKKGDLIHLRKRLDAHWYHGEMNGAEGVFPVNYVQVVVPLPVPQCRALYDFRMGPNEEDGCLAFNKGAVITVLRRVDQNWAEGRMGECIGIFPIAFVEMNGMAKRIMEQAAAAAAAAATATAAAASSAAPAEPLRNVPLPQPTPQSSAAALSASSELLFSSDSSSSTLTNSTNSSPSTSSSTSTSTPTSPVTNVVIRQTLANNRAANEHKRHSLTVLSGASSVAMAHHQNHHQHHSNRHSVEILSAPDPPGDHTPAGDPFAQHSSTKPPQQRRSHPHPHEASATSSSRSSSNHKPEPSNVRTRIVRSGVHHHHPQGAAAAAGHPTLPANYIAVFPYKPHKADELELKKGAVYYVTERCQDGWFKGASRGNQSGVFPGNYVAPLRSNQRDRNQLLNLKQQANIIGQNVATAAAASTAVQPQASSHQPHGASRSSPQHPAQQTPQGHHRSQHSGRSVCIPPPELPPRSAAIADSVWTKPLGQHVESFFSRKSASGSSTKTDSAKQSSSSSSSATNGTISLMKRLTNIKRSKSPTHGQTLPASAYSMDNPVFEDATDSNAAAAAPLKPQRNAQLVHPVHVRSGSCPSQLLQNLSLDGTGMPVYGSQRLKGYKERANLPGHPESQARLTPSRQPSSHSNALLTPQHSAAGRANNGPPPTTSNHRKSHSLDATTIASQMSHSASNGIKYHKSSSHVQNAPPAERFRCIVPYPPNGEFELELQLNDIVMVHKKRDNGWYKGAHARTGRIGLFPASFVEPDA